MVVKSLHQIFYYHSKYLNSMKCREISMGPSIRTIQCSLCQSAGKLTLQAESPSSSQYHWLDRQRASYHQTSQMAVMTSTLRRYCWLANSFPIGGLRASVPRGATLASPPGFARARSLVSGWVFHRPPTVSQQRPATRLGGLWPRLTCSSLPFSHGIIYSLSNWRWPWGLVLFLLQS
jgi:hypothetical protein